MGSDTKNIELHRRTSGRRYSDRGVIRNSSIIAVLLLAAVYSFSKDLNSRLYKITPIGTSGNDAGQQEKANY